MKNKTIKCHIFMFLFSMLFFVSANAEDVLYEEISLEDATIYLGGADCLCKSKANCEVDTLPDQWEYVDCDNSRFSTYYKGGTNKYFTCQDGYHRKGCNDEASGISGCYKYLLVKVTSSTNGKCRHNGFNYSKKQIHKKDCKQAE